MANYWLEKIKAKNAWFGGGHRRGHVPSVVDVFARKVNPIVSGDIFCPGPGWKIWGVDRSNTFPAKWDAFAKDLAAHILLGYSSFEEDPSCRVKFNLGSVYLQHPEIRVGARRALLKLKKDGMIEQKHIDLVLKG